jgi:hypothetical protein
VPDFSDGCVDARLDVYEHVFSPQTVDDVAAGDELVPALDQQDQEIHWLTLEPDRAAKVAQSVRGNVELEILKAIRLL